MTLTSKTSTRTPTSVGQSTTTAATDYQSRDDHYHPIMSESFSTGKKSSRVGYKGETAASKAQSPAKALLKYCSLSAVRYILELSARLRTGGPKVSPSTFQCTPREFVWCHCKSQDAIHWYTRAAAPQVPEESENGLRTTTMISCCPDRDKEAAEEDEEFEGDDGVRYLSVLARCVCDETHKIKNARTRVFKAVDYLCAPLKWYDTARPLINSIIDLMGPLYLFWRDEFEDDHMTLDDFDLSCDGLPVYSEDRIAIVCAPNYAEKYGDTLPFLFNPRRYARMAHKDILHGEVAVNVVRPLLMRLQLK
ncbi:hypothetical protein EDD36DRAFT_462747 [Exophiala viscosa]|uniref:SNF2 N-terminal domain-containing protein n=1 Tax=Exophiala viscosa TaxID=2486360 RepID=A0AAN6E228_9EURO|nr:hypothetical protein EDD36DRAFT_462747 [Exophiala viscosa]